MNGYACSEQDVLLDTYGPEIAGIAHLSASAGTFALRRAHYFNEAGYFNETGHESSVGVEQQQALTNYIMNGDFDAEQKMIVHNLRRVVDIAKRYANCGVSFFDLVRENNPGLIGALEKFEVEGRFCFSAYATQCIRQYIERAITNRNNRASSGVSSNIPARVCAIADAGCFALESLENIGGCNDGLA